MPILFIVFWLLALALSNTVYADELDAVLGKALFERIWVAAPASTQATDGLGPLFNARSCARCHRNAGRGTLQIDNKNELNSPALVLQLSHDPIYGRQLQTNSIHGHAAEARISVKTQTKRALLAEGQEVILTQLIYQPVELAYGKLHPTTTLSPRIAPALHGLGWIERIPVDEILRYADPDDDNGDGISGRAHWLESSRLGRFGWKANSPSLLAQTAQALALDMGLSSPWQTAHGGDCTTQQTACRDAIHGNSERFQGFELSDEMVFLIVRYLQRLAAPKSSSQPDEPGEQLFRQLGCASCHRPSFTLENKAIHPYSDFLLHDMGDALADHPRHELDRREWRTAPLWGLNRVLQNDHAALLHDGRAGSIIEAILWHGGEAQAARNRFINLSENERETLLDFLKKL